MKELKCIIETSLINEKKMIREDLYEGRALEILILLLKGEKTATEIARSIKLPIFSTRLYISRLLQAEMIVVSNSIREEKAIEKVYKLVTTKLDIINKHTSSEGSSKSEECLAMANHFSGMSKKAISNIYKYSDEPYIIKGCFISSNTERMNEFKKRLNDLIDEFDAAEDVNEDKTYGLIVNFTPYELEDL